MPKYGDFGFGFVTGVRQVWVYKADVKPETLRSDPKAARTPKLGSCITEGTVQE